MRKRYVFLIAILLLAFTGGLAWQFSQPREPMYEGRPLSYWLAGYDTATRTETSQQSADDAVREVGTNAIPTLLRMLREKDSPLKRKFFALLEKQHILKIPHRSAAELNYEGLKGFEILGASAKEAAPALVKIYECDISTVSTVYAAWSLGAIGPGAKDAVPILLKGMSSPNIGTRYSTMYALGMIHSEPEFVVPVLIKQLTNSPELNDRYCAVTAEALGNFGADAKPAVPALISLLKASDNSLHTKVLYALIQIDPQTAANLSTNLPATQTPP